MASADGVLRLELGITSYREYLITNCLGSDARQVLERDGLREHGGAGAHLSNALGCEAVLVTRDEQVVLLRRSAAITSAAGQYNGPSGHPEPERAGIARADADADADAVVRELFGSVIDEVHDETNVLRESLSEPRLIGAYMLCMPRPLAARHHRHCAHTYVMLTHKKSRLRQPHRCARGAAGMMADTCHKPDLLFLVATSLDADAVRANFAGARCTLYANARLPKLRPSLTTAP